MSVSDRIKRFLAICLVAIFLGGLLSGASIWLARLHQENSASNPSTIGGAFTLVDETGQTQSDLSYSGKFLLIYFGFASCPAICPTELQKMSDAYSALPKPLQAQIQPLFISLDPERDTPQILKDYTSMFLPNLIGLTGSPAQIEQVKKVYKVYSAKVPQGDSYTIDHSSFLYFMDTHGKSLALFKPADTPETIAATIKSLMAPKP